MQEQTAETLQGPAVPEELRRFLWDIQSMVELADSDREILLIGRDLMGRLLASDDCLPDVFATPDPKHCQQFQLYHDDLERFTVVSTVLAPGQILPVVQDDVWQIRGVLRGAVERARFALSDDGKPTPSGAPAVLAKGDIETNPKNTGAVRLRNALSDAVSICIDVYGGELSILQRRTLAPGGVVDEGPVVYANPEDAPPYDIRSIQARIVD